MVKYLTKRTLRSLLTLIIIVSVVFILLRQLPIEGYFSNIDKLSDAQIQGRLEVLGLNDPMYEQLFNFFKSALHGDLGTSYVYRDNVAVTKILAPKIPISVKLGSLSLLVALIVGLPMGTLMARKKGGWFDRFGTGFIVFIEAVPAAVYYLFIQMYGTKLFGISLLFNADKISSWILPVFSMALGNIAYYAMWLRRYMVDQSTKDYVLLARAKGLSERQIMFRHLFRNAFVPMAQYIPTSFLNTVIGSIYIESLYSIPGMGGLLVDVIKKQDNTMVQAIVVLYATVGVIGLILGDLLMVAIDPRISLVRKGGKR